MSQRDVVFTPFMLRVRGTLDGEDTWVPPQLRPSMVQPVAAATDAWFSLRARSEQVLAEANAMLGGRAPLLDLDDEFGTGELAFVMRYGRRCVRLSMGQRGRRAWVELRQSGEQTAGPVEPVDLSVLEDLIVDMLWSERRNGNG